MGPLNPCFKLLMISAGIIWPGLQNPGGSGWTHTCAYLLACNRFLRFTSAAAPAGLLAGSSISFKIDDYVIIH